MKAYISAGDPVTDRMIEALLAHSGCHDEGLAVCIETECIPESTEGVIVLYRNVEYLESEAHISLEGSYRGRYRAVPLPLDVGEFTVAASDICRQIQGSAPIFRGDDASLLYDKKALTVTKNGRSVTLSPKEAELFSLLYNSLGTPVSRESLRERLWAHTDNTNAPDVYASYLRKKLTPILGDGAVICIRGKGYMLKVD